MSRSVDNPQVSNSHNVYILGAGFSRAAGYPLMHDFMRMMMEARDWAAQSTDDRAKEVAAIDEVLRFRLQAAAAAHRTPINVDNVEELFSLASAVGGEQLDRAMTWAIATTLDFASQTDFSPLGRLEMEVMQHTVPPTGVLEQTPGVEGHEVITIDPYAGMGSVLASAFCPGVGHKNTVITFNYDTVLEQALGRLDRPFTYALRADRCQVKSRRGGSAESDGDLRILKLHGSVNWVQLASFTVFDDYASGSRKDRPPVLVPPTWRRKDGGREPAGQLDHVWGGAVEALQTATHLIVIGFSMPRTDSHFKYLIAAGLMRNISLRSVTIVNPRIDDALEKRARAVFRPELQEQGVLRYVKDTAEHYLIDRDQMARIDRALAVGRRNPSWGS